MNDKRVIVVDQTIREGMQYRGLMFSLEERKQILEFQEKLNIDISQAAYPPAHVSEGLHLNHLHEFTSAQGFHIRVAGLCRALPEDVRGMIQSGISDFHLHSGINQNMLDRFGEDELFREVRNSVRLIQNGVDHPCINLAFADIGRTDPALLNTFVDYAVEELQVDIVNLPDTSGSMAPNAYHDAVRRIVLRIQNKPARIAVHCHNDLGMANANTVLGVIAGASVIEACALGIGERNGIADLYAVCTVLKDQGYDIRVKTENHDAFKAYYEYIHRLCVAKTGFGPLNYNTPAFGEAVKTHVAGTHGIIEYGMSDEKKYFLNVLCGKNLVKAFLTQNSIAYDPKKLTKIVDRIKEKSAAESRPLTLDDVRFIVDETG